MKMYIANCTLQDHDFIYRLPESRGNRTQRVLAGQQIQISGDNLSQADVDAIVKQHHIYGLTRVSEIDRKKKFVGLAYDIDQKIALNRIRYALDHNQDVLKERGKQQRLEAAVASHDAIQGNNPALKSLDVSIEEQETKSNPDPTLSETITVAKDAPEGDSGVTSGREAQRARNDKSGKRGR